MQSRDGHVGSRESPVGGQGYNRREVSIAIAAFAAQIGNASFASATPKPEWGILTGPPEQAYYQQGLKLKKYLHNRAQLNVIETDGSRENIHSLWKKPDAQWAFVQADVFDNELWRYSRICRPAWIAQYKVLARLFDEQVHVVTLKSSRVENLRDLAGRVAIGESESGTNFTATFVLEKAKARLKNPVEKFRLGPGEAKEALFQGQLDAFFAVHGQDVAGKRPTLLDVAKDPRVSQLKLVAIDTEQDIELSADDREVYHEVTLNKLDYPFLDGRVRTLATTAVLIFDHKKVSCADASYVAKIVDENFTTRPLPLRPGWERCEERKCKERKE